MKKKLNLNISKSIYDKDSDVKLQIKPLNDNLYRHEIPFK